MKEKVTTRNPWAWIPSLYFAEGMPYVIVMTVSVIMYKNLGMSNADIALYTSWLYLPWVIKPFWSPFVDLIKTKRLWIVAMQFIIGVALAGVAFTIHADSYVQYTLAFFWLLAFSSATHDIAADGFYMLGLSKSDQAFFIGIRSTFYRFAMLAGQGLFVIIAGYFEDIYSVKTAWMIVMVILAVLFVGFSLYHKFVFPYPLTDKQRDKWDSRKFINDFFLSIAKFFQKREILIILGFLLFYRLGESQLVKIAAPFLLDLKKAGGLALSTTEVGVIYGTVGVIALVIGGILGGVLASRYGLKKCIWWMLIAINVPNVVYVYLSAVQPDSFVLISSLIAIEQFGYGFGFTAYMLYMIMISEGEYKTAHYAIATGIMAFGMMIPGMFSGRIQEAVGYQSFFIWVLISTIPAFLITIFIKINSDFGKKNNG